MSIIILMITLGRIVGDRGVIDEVAHQTLERLLRPRVARVELDDVVPALAQDHLMSSDAHQMLIRCSSDAHQMRRATLAALVLPTPGGPERSAALTNPFSPFGSPRPSPD